MLCETKEAAATLDPVVVGGADTRETTARSAQLFHILGTAGDKARREAILMTTCDHSLVQRMCHPYDSTRLPRAASPSKCSKHESRGQ